MGADFFFSITPRLYDDGNDPVERQKLMMYVEMRGLLQKPDS